jgi:methylated-DNA-[protein]-cysteine S-methyltransferase
MNRLPIKTELGTCTLLWEGDRVTGFRLPDGSPHANAGSFPSAESSAGVSPAFATDAGGMPALLGAPEGTSDWVLALARRVQAHMAGDLQDFADVPFDWERVGEFQRDVYRVALGVKAGVTWSYGQVAHALGMPPGGARSVGTALGQNPWPLLVPCHRFIGADGKMTGFSAPGGIKTKLKLLALEGAQLFAE